MEDQSESETPADMASRIERTLSDQEQKRILEEKERIENFPPTLEHGRPKSFGYLMLLLGVLFGAAFGVALYFVIPGQPAASEVRSSAADSVEFLEANRLLSLGQTDSARNKYLTLISEHPEEPRSYNNLASLYASEGDLEKARALLDRALKTDQDYLTIYRNIGMVYSAMARDSYGKAL